MGALVAVATAYWLAVLAFVADAPQVHTKSVLSALFFVVMFVVSMAYHSYALIVVDAYGITYRGLLGTRRFSFKDIERFAIVPGPVTLYVLRAGSRELLFSSFIGRHKKLGELVRERAQLWRSHA